MDENTRAYLTGSLDKVYTTLQGMEIAPKPENVRILSLVYDELKAMFDLVTKPAEDPGKEEDGDV